MTVNSTDIVNRAIQLIGANQPLVTGTAPTFDSSKAGVAASLLYNSCIQTVARQFGWDFSRNTVALVATGNEAPYPWSEEYSYPSNGVEVRQVTPTSGSDPNNPLPVDFEVANAVVSGTQGRVIHTNLTPAQAVYTNQPSEDTWDALFTESVVRLLASELAVALSGKPDSGRDLLTQSGQFTQVGTQRPD